MAHHRSVVRGLLDEDQTKSGSWPWRYPLSFFVAAAVLAFSSPAGADPKASTRSIAHQQMLNIVDANAPIAAGPSRWERELQDRSTALKRSPGPSAAAIVPILDAVGELGGEVEPERLIAFFDRVAKDRRRSELVRAYARLQLAALWEQERDLQAARAELDATGSLLEWQIMGPFDNSGRRGETTAYPPEQQPYSAGQAFEGKLAGESLTWRAVDYEAIPAHGLISLDDVVRPNVDATAYATCWVHVERETPAAIRLGATGPYVVWVDGQRVGQGDAYRPVHPLQDAHGVTLRSGWNRVLIKVSVLERMWAFQMRVTRPDGTRIPDLKTQAEAPSEWTPEDSTERPIPRVRSLRAELEAEYERKNDPRGGLTLLEFYRHTDPFDRDDDMPTSLARELDQRLKTSRSAELHAQVARDPNEAAIAVRSGIERARREGASATSRLAQLLLELAWIQRSVGLHDRYEALIEEAFQTSPNDAVVEIELITQASNDGYRWLALRWMKDLARRNPNSTTVAYAVAAAMADLGLTKEAFEYLSSLSQRHGMRMSDVTSPIELLLALGRADEAAALARSVAQSTPGRPSAHVMVAKLEEARGDIDAAREAWRTAIALIPHDAILHAELGRLMLRTNDLDAAIASFERSLELRPQQPDIRDLLATLRPTTSSDLIDRFAVDLETIARTETPAAWAGKSAGILRHINAVKVLPNGLTERLEQRIIRVLDDRGVRAQAVQAISFDPAESMVEVRRARVRRRDGTIENIGNVRMSSLTSAGFRMYYDKRQLQVVFEGLQAGDTLEVAFLIRDIAARNMFDQYFGDVMFVQGVEPQQRVEYILEAPKNKPIFFNLEGVEVGPAPDGPFTRYRYVVNNPAPIKPEQSMPGWTEVADYLHASTYQTWDQVGDWYWELVREQLVANEDIRNAVAQTLAKLPADASEADKVEAIYTYVVRNTRYVGLEFGIHGFKPYRTTEVFSRRFGDCKDKASLLKVMLAEAGIDSHLVLVRTRDQGTIPRHPASLAVFNHAITYVPSLDLFLDGTAEWSGPRELPEGDQGASVLIVKDGRGAEFRQIGMSDAVANVNATSQRIKLQSNGAAEIDHRLVVTGKDAAGIRFQLQSAEQRTERIQQSLGAVYSGGQVTAVEAPNIESIQQPAQVSAHVRAPRWANRDGDRLRFAVLGRDSQLTTGLAAAAERTQDLVLGPPSVETFDLEIQRPPGYSWGAVPSSQALESAAGRFDLEISTTDTEARVRARIELRSSRITPDEYPAFRAFLSDIDRSLERSFELIPVE